jgi:CheY-like chemotaxis protein
MDKDLILVVDDDFNIRQLIEYTLVKTGYRVHSSKTGKDALKFLEGNRPAAVILDIVMPDMDGYTFLRKLRATSFLKDIPVIISSGKSGLKEFFELEDREFRPDAFLSKPYKMDELEETVKEVLNAD